MNKTEHPIPFTEQQVLATLEGRMTQTRRVILLPRWMEPPDEEGDFEIDSAFDDGKRVPWPYAIAKYSGCLAEIKCPYGQPGDRLWVRETIWGLHETEWNEASGSSIDHGSDLSLGKGHHSGIDYVATPRIMSLPKLEHLQIRNIPKETDVPGDWWLAPPDDWDGHNEEEHLKRGQWEFMPWVDYTKHPSVHMPRWASRLTLEVVSIRVERVSLVTAADAEAEGIVKEWDGTAYWYKNYQPGATAMYKQQPVKSFMTLWDSINAKRGFGWDANPWVWVIEFKPTT